MKRRSSRKATRIIAEQEVTQRVVAVKKEIVYRKEHQFNVSNIDTLHLIILLCSETRDGPHLFTD